MTEHYHYSRTIMEYKCEYCLPYLLCNLPKEIQQEINFWIEECKKIKNHPLAELKSHENVAYLSMDGKKHNSYQCSVPTHLIENSFWLAYTLRVCASYWGGNHRDYKVRKWEGHFDGYDIWANFAYRGDDNPIHNHAGNISGVIYVQNFGHPTIFPKHNTEYIGKNGTMILFPSNTLHYVNPQQINEERITIAFNIIKL
jgi:hypothetical protein